MSLVNDVMEVLTFAAFRPAPHDSTASWLARFKGKKTLILNVNKDFVEWRGLDKNGNLSGSGKESGDFKTVADSQGQAWKKLAEEWVLISTNTRFMVTLEKNLSRREGYQTIIRNDPKSIIGAKYDRSKRYAITHNPQTSSSIMLATDESMITEAEEKLNEMGLKIGRYCCGLFCMMGNTLLKLHKNVAKIGQNACLITCCGDSVSIIRKQANQWADVRCRSSVFNGDLGSVLPIVSPVIDRLPDKTPIIIIGDDPQSPLQAALVKEFASKGARDVSKAGYLWNVLTDKDLL